MPSQRRAARARALRVGPPRPPGSVAERLLLALGYGTGLVALAGLLLHVSGFGIWASSWFGLIAVGLLIAALRLRLLPLLVRVGAGLARVPALATRRNLVVAVLTTFFLAAAFVVTLASLGLRDTRFSQLWLVPDGAATVKVGIRNGEAGRTSYRLRVLSQGSVQEFAVDLAKGETFEVRTAVRSARDAVAYLYRADSPGQPYRFAGTPPAP